VCRIPGYQDNDYPDQRADQRVNNRDSIAHHCRLPTADCPLPTAHCPLPLKCRLFVRSHWNAVSGTGSGCHSSAVFSALERAADAQKRVPTIKSLHLRSAPCLLPPAYCSLPTCPLPN
jgi:hypothetical protein